VSGFGVFRALTARGGLSCPLVEGSAGLTPAHGAGAVVLVRRSEARARAVPVRAVLRAVGLANAGRGLPLKPDAAAVAAALRRAVAGAGGKGAVAVGHVECHATGTAQGDAAEVAAVREVLGATKGVYGHALTAAALAVRRGLAGSRCKESATG